MSSRLLTPVLEGYDGVPGRRMSAAEWIDEQEFRAAKPRARNEATWDDVPMSDVGAARRRRARRRPVSDIWA